MSNRHAGYAEEFNRLLVEQATVVRSMKYGYEPTNDELIRARADRLVELAELLGEPVRGGLEPEAYVNSRISLWLQANPLALTSDRVHEAIESFHQPKPDTHVTTGVFVEIGDLRNGGYSYRAMIDDLKVGQQLTFAVPESVAEHFRQQGRRQVKREFANLLGLKSEL